MFEVGELYVVDEIARGDAYYKNREKIIGSIVKITKIDSCIHCTEQWELTKSQPYSPLGILTFLNTVKMHKLLNNDIDKLFFELGYI